MEYITTIQISKEVRERMSELKGEGITYNRFITELLDQYENRNKASKGGPVSDNK